MTTQTSKSDQVHLVVGAEESCEPTRLENLDSSAVPTVTEGLRNDDPDVVLSLSRDVATPHADPRKCERPSAEFKSHIDGTTTLLGEVHRGEGVISQNHVDRDLTLQRDDQAPTREAFDVSRREIDPEIMRHHAKLRSVSRRVMELERRLGVVRDEKNLRRERVQLGLEVSVAGERGVWASEFPFMIVLFALIAVVLPTAYKYAFSA